mmetsp:Transcript_5438/g.6608  ORF Transcript_5438/g.6608 Transcript_5438/m.6608 type:complete len:153 (+) Transcript_5438:1348-1806(+)
MIHRTSLHSFSFLPMPKPTNSYMLFCKEHRADTIRDYPNMPNTAISSILGAKWRALTPQEKEPYIRRANLLRQEYMKTHHKENEEILKNSFTFTVYPQQPPSNDGLPTRAMMNYPEPPSLTYDKHFYNSKETLSSFVYPARTSEVTWSFHNS